jgi:hypothetical protein
MLTLVADSSAPRDPHARWAHYRKHLIDANRVIDTLQTKIAKLEADIIKVRADAAYSLSLCVTRREAEEGRIDAFRLAIGKACAVVEGPESVPCDWSEEIWKLPNPKPKWRK